MILTIYDELLIIENKPFCYNHALVYKWIGWVGYNFYTAVNVFQLKRWRFDCTANNLMKNDSLYSKK